MGKFIDLTGKKFGRWLVLSKSNERTKSGIVLWNCKCDCGKEKLVSVYNLTNGRSKSCGCLNKEIISGDKGPKNDLNGKRFGKLLVVGLVGKKKKYYYWNCRCDCGCAVEIRGTTLTRKNRPSRTCGGKEHKIEDLTGKRFGRWVVIKRVFIDDKTKTKSPRWLCRCDCGKEKDVSSLSLRCRSKSCGCLNDEVRKWRKKNLQFGENNHNWNPNLTDEDRQWNREYAVKKITKWRNNVYERDNYICDKCGYSEGGILIAHHLDGYHWCKEKRFEVDNGITLCKDCHKKFHHKYGNRNNTKKQYEEFKNNCIKI